MMTNAQIAKYLDIAPADIRETAERPDTGETVVILKDYRKFVIAPGTPAAEKAAKLPLPADLK